MQGIEVKESASFWRVFRGDEVMCKPSFEKLIQVSQVDMSMEEHMSIEETEYLNLQRIS